MEPCLFEEFTGFSPETFIFLKGLQTHNNKAWFEKHRQDYEQYLLNPMRCLVMELGEFMLTIDGGFETTPAVNKTISRIYRDTRFSKDKSLLRANMWITFKQAVKDWQGKPAYFFELFPDGYRYGLGYYSATPATMTKLRDKIDEGSEDFKTVFAQFQEQDVFTLAGNKYKRVFNPDHPPEIQEWYQRKNLYVVSNHPIEETLFSVDLLDELIISFQSISPLYHFLKGL